MANSLNCHFVSRFLTTPWESGQRQLRYYDFETRQLGTRSSRTLFAEEGTNTPAVEERLNRLVETPMAHAMSSLAGPQSAGVIEVGDPSLFTALMLLLSLQPLRSGTGNGAQGVKSAVMSSHEEIERMVHEGRERFHLVRARADSRMRLFYPSRGFFLLPVERPGGLFEGAFAIPLTPMFALVLVSRDTDLAALQQTWTGGLVSNFSVGFRSSRVVMHPDVEFVLGGDDLCRAIEEARTDSIRVAQSCREVNGVLKKMDAIDGLTGCSDR